MTCDTNATEANEFYSMDLNNASSCFLKITVKGDPDRHRLLLWINGSNGESDEYWDQVAGGETQVLRWQLFRILFSFQECGGDGLWHDLYLDQSMRGASVADKVIVADEGSKSITLSSSDSGGTKLEADFQWDQAIQDEARPKGDTYDLTFTAYECFRTMSSGPFGASEQDTVYMTIVVTAPDYSFKPVVLGPYVNGVARKPLNIKFRNIFFPRNNSGKLVIVCSMVNQGHDPKGDAIRKVAAFIDAHRDPVPTDWLNAFAAAIPDLIASLDTDCDGFMFTETDTFDGSQLFAASGQTITRDITTASRCRSLGDLAHYNFTYSITRTSN